MNKIKQVTVPEGSIGDYRVEKFTISEKEAGFYNINCHGRGVDSGTYTRLMRGTKCIMSDTFEEMRDHSEPIYRASGKCLINGLGIGLVLKNMLDKKEVKHVTVIEISKEVIDLVGKYYINKYKERVSIINANAYEWKPVKGMRYDVVWHDIWDDICSDNLPGMTKLHRKYGRICDWQGSWAKQECLRARGY